MHFTKTISLAVFVSILQEKEEGLSFVSLVYINFKLGSSGVLIEFCVSSRCSVTFQIGGILKVFTFSKRITNTRVYFPFRMVALLIVKNPYLNYGWDGKRKKKKKNQPVMEGGEKK